VPSVLPDCAVYQAHRRTIISYCLAHHLTNTLGVLFRSNQTGHLEVCSRLSTAMMEKRLFWSAFWLLWSAGAITDAIFAALVRIPTTPVAAILLMRGHSQKPLLVGTEATEITVELAIAVSCGLLAAHRIGLGAPIVEKWLCGEPIKSQVRPSWDRIGNPQCVCCFCFRPSVGARSCASCLRMWDRLSLLKITSAW